MARIITKGLIGLQDLNVGIGTFTRATSTGGTQTLSQINLGNIGTVASASLTAQTANIVLTTLYTTPATGAGIYRISTHLMVHAANATQDVLQVFFTYQNGISVPSVLLGTIDCSYAAGSEVQTSSRLFYSIAGASISYSASLASALGAGSYDLRLRLEYLG